MSTLEFRDTCGDNYDNNTTHIGYFWDSLFNSGIISVVSGVAGMTSNCIRMTIASLTSDGGCLKNLSNASSKAAHARFIVGTLPPSGYIDFLRFCNTGTTQIAIRYSSSGTISAWCGNTKLCESSPAVVASSTAFVVSVGVAFSSTATGSVTVQVNGIQVCAASNVVTTTDATNNCNQFYLVYPNAAGGQVHYYDDVIVDTGTTALRAPQKNIWLPATGAGRYSAMTAVGAASGYQCVTDTTPEPDDDTTYVKAATSGLSNAYALTNPNPTNVDFGLHRIIVAKTDDGGAATLTPGFSNGTTDASGTAIAVPSSYQALRQSWDSNPITNAQPTASDLSTLQVLDTRSA